MAKRKFYAVKIGKVPGIYGTWDECKLQVEGVSGAVYKSFSTMQDAEGFINNLEQDLESQESCDEGEQISNSKIEDAITNLNDGDVIAFVDGSYDATEEKSGFGVILIDHVGVVTTLYKSFTKNLGEEFIKMRNVSAELEGVIEAVNWAVQYNKNKISIYYDYIGIEEWAQKRWKAKTEITKKYRDFIEAKSKLIKLEFIKVPAHSGVRYNEEADALAKRSLLVKGFKTYKDGSVYFTGYGLDEWKTIITCIDEENLALHQDDKKLKVTISKLDKRNKIIIEKAKEKLIINCYLSNNSYVQGKQGVLFQKIISTAIELTSNNQKAIEILNNIHALSLTEVEIVNRFEELMPNYTECSNIKQYKTLLSAVYNTMLVGYMPDYTCLITPIFRAYEFYLHKILGEKMEVETATVNGKNNFGYFTKDSNGKYECNHSSVSKLGEKQKNYLNELYNSYNTIRHPYSHWSSDDYDTAVITTMNQAQELILKGLTLFNKYYKIF